MAWWQKKLLRFALSRTGLLDDQALDLDNLGLTFGKSNVVELKDVGLNIPRISKLAQLPPGLRVQTARILSLRLTVPADIYQSSIIAEVDGVELCLKLEEKEPTVDTTKAQKRSGARSPTTARSPQHRKAHRRIHSPPPYRHGRSDDNEAAYIPTADELAKSFLLEEPLQERRQLEASLALGTKGVEESFASSSSGGDEVGTGAAVGLPGFLAGFLQGIIDRLQVSVKNVVVTLDTNIGDEVEQAAPITLRLRIGSASLEKTSSDGHHSEADRKVSFDDISLDLVTDAGTFSELSAFTAPNSPILSRQSGEVSPRGKDTLGKSAAIELPPVPAYTSSFHDDHATGVMDALPAGQNGRPQYAEDSQSTFDIRAGDDNITWASRRSKSSSTTEDLWKSVGSEDDLPGSLLFERAAVSREHSSRAASPITHRQRRSVSPYARNLQSPGSWPTLGEHPDRYQTQRSPGSWPNLDQSQNSFFQPLAPGHFDVVEEQRMNAEESSLLDESTSDLTDPSAGMNQDLSESRMFTHEEARSLYMSAISHESRMHIPGGWSPEAPSSERSASPEVTRIDMSARSGSGQKAPHPPQPATRPATIDNDLAYGDRPYSTPKAPLSAHSTPRARSPEHAEPERFDAAGSQRVSKQLVHISAVVLSLATGGASTEAPEQVNPPQGREARSTMMHGMPGAFSEYSQMAASRSRFGGSAMFTNPPVGNSVNFERPVEAESKARSIGVAVGSVKCQFDVACCKLIYRLSTSIVAILDTPSSSTQGEAATTTSTPTTEVLTSLSVNDIHVAFKDAMSDTLQAANSTESSFDGVATLVCRQLKVNTSSTEKTVHSGTLQVFIGRSCLLSFARRQMVDASTDLTDHTPDVEVSINNVFSGVRRGITNINVETPPIKLLLNLPIIDEAFEFLGGLSSVLEAGTSMLSESGIGTSDSSPLKPTKAVRFQGEVLFEERGPEVKMNATLGEITLTLQGSMCYAVLETTAVRSVYREARISATVDQVQLSGPHFRSSENVRPMTAVLSVLRLDYLHSPPDSDLERLLSLLTPSKDKYDTDDDILIDTLLRQRQKAAVVKLSADSAKAKCSDWSCLPPLTALTKELSRLSAVAKYLPKDDRPGPLALIKIREIEAALPVNERFGLLHVKLTDLHCAQVDLPALLALSVGGVRVSQGGEVAVVHPLVPPSEVDNLPMIMLRNLGDEIDPTVKIKLFNVAVEYTVPVLLDLTGMDRESDADDIMAELGRSVTTLMSPNAEAEAGKHSTTSKGAPKSVKLDLLVHDCALGLSPQKLSSKALLVIADASFATSVPPEATAKASAKIRRAGLFVADHVITESIEAPMRARDAPSNTAVKVKLVGLLSRLGYISVGSIMTMTVTVQAEQGAQKDDSTIDVHVKNELLLLETCADSTQTLIATLNGLTPPTPPSKQAKFLTEPMAIEDMMASFTGEPYAKPEQTPHTLFDVEEEPEDDAMFDMKAFEEDDDGLLTESEMTSSLYGPVSGMLQGVDQSEDDNDASEYFAATAESLLEDDPFVMTIPPPDAPLGDAALVRELNKQGRPAESEDLVDLGLFEFEDVGYDALDGQQTALGSIHRFNTPVTSQKRHPSRTAHQKLPFRLQLRDVHVIWNIYDGYDWQRTRDGITEAVEQVEYRAEQRKAKRRRSQMQEDEDESVIGDFLFNSIYIGVPSNQDAQDLRRQINRHIDDLASETESVPMSGISRPSGFSAPLRSRTRRRLKLERSRTHKVRFELTGVSADVLVYPHDSAELVSSVDVRVKDVEVFDNVPTSTWKKFLTSLNDDPYGREMSKPMAHIEILNIRTLEHYAASELNMHVSVLPLRLHVDQDALDFITRFFEFKDDSVVPDGPPDEQPFIQRLEVDTVDLRLDYKPKTVDYAGLRSGHTNEFMNFIILDAANIRLRHAIIYGIRGFDPLHKTLNDIWMPDVKRNQLPTVLAGLAPVRGLVNLTSGVRDVVAIPIREYQKDGRLFRSIQKGAFQFGKTTSAELVRLGAKVAIGTQNFLTGAEGLLAPGSASPSSRPRLSPTEHGWHDIAEEDSHHERRAISSYANQPLSVFGGLRNARRFLEHDLLTARDALIAVQGEIMESSGAGSAVAAVARRAPNIILRPIIGTSRAVGTALMGVGNAIDRDNVRRMDDKYKSR